LRMSKPSFFVLANLIKHHIGFVTTGRRPQAPVFLQLAVFLYRMGMAGGGSTLAHTGLALGLGEGTVHSYTVRVVEALQNIRTHWIKWPTKEARQKHAKRVGEASKGVFSGCIGFIDGTFLNLQYTPETNHYFYFNRKSTYAIGAMAVCTDNRQIVYLRVGDTSAVHDTTVFSRSYLSQTPSQYFGDGEYLIGDSAYTPTATMIVPFKKPRARQPLPKRFNFALSQRRIVIEHAFGMIKARFPALTNVPIRIRDTDSHAMVVNWFVAGVVLHNFLIARRDEMKWTQETEWEEILKDILQSQDYERV
ncbi:hypothetical protein BJ508DRAFT_200657, partial [Ascobolus immersus RN42]